MSIAIAVSAPALGQIWPEQGGIFIGSRLIEGQLHHIVAAECQHDIKGVKFSDVENSVAVVATIEGFGDWRAPSQDDLMLAYVNAREHFERAGYESIYWSNTPRSEYSAWAVDFDFGYVFNYFRSNEFRVRPFRSILASSI